MNAENDARRRFVCRRQRDLTPMSRLLAGALLLCTLISMGARVAADGGLGYEAGLDDDGEWGDDMGYQSDPAYEQYAERLQQQLESLRKEHDEIFGRADTNKVLFYSILLLRSIPIRKQWQLSQQAHPRFNPLDFCAHVCALVFLAQDYPYFDRPSARRTGR